MYLKKPPLSFTFYASEIQKDQKIYELHLTVEFDNGLLKICYTCIKVVDDSKILILKLNSNVKLDLQHI